MKVTWCVPRWSYVRREARGIRSELRKIAGGRVLGAGAAAAVLIVLALKRAFPALDVGPLFGKAILAVAGVVGLMAANLLVLLVVPPIVKVTPEWIQRTHGQANWRAARDDLAGLKVVIFAPGLRRLSFRWKGRRRSMGLAGSVDLDELLAALPMRAKVVDARRRFARLGGRGLSAGRADTLGFRSRRRRGSRGRR